MREKLRFEYFYKSNECKADTAKDKDCICWNDEGSGIYKDQNHNDEIPMVEWRIKVLTLK